MYPVDVVKIEIVDFDDVNQYLDLGWRLVTTYTYVPDFMYPNHTRVNYVLAWCKGDPVYP